jgi:hypothetical protein
MQTLRPLLRFYRARSTWHGLTPIKRVSGKTLSIGPPSTMALVDAYGGVDKGNWRMILEL